MVYQAAAEGSQQLVLLGADGVGRTLLAGLPGAKSRPVVSADGSRLAFVVGTGAAPELWSASVDGQGARRVLPCRGSCLGYDSASWSPDGRQLLALRFDGPVGDGDLPSGSTLQVVDLATGKSRDVRHSATGELFAGPRWSPDGRSYCVTVQSGTPGGETSRSLIFVGSIGGRSRPRPLTPANAMAASCDWAPDGRSLVYATFDPDSFPESSAASNLYRIPARGGSPEQITAFDAGDDRAAQPRWAPDGRRVVFTRVAADDPGVRRLVVIGLTDRRISPLVGDERPVIGQYAAPVPRRGG